jgi:hypothetical protein
MFQDLMLLNASAHVIFDIPVPSLKYPHELEKAKSYSLTKSKKKKHSTASQIY